MADINQDIAAYETQKQQLELEHMGKWVVFHEKTLIGIYPSMEDAAIEAVARFGRGPFLIRQIGAPPLTLPASVVYHPDYGKREMRI